ASPTSAVDVALTVDSIDAATGSMRMRLHASAGERLPPDGALVVTSVGGIPTITVAPNRLNQEQSTTLLFQKGDVVDYPFETYGATLQLVALRGTDPTIAPGSDRPRLDIGAIALSNAAGFSITARSRVDADGVVSIDYLVRRTLGTRGWVLAMMAIYWAVAIGAAAVTVLVVTRKRAWETRLLAWLGALLFAMVTFRNAAPGSPPVGTFLDYTSVFESIGIVALALVVLVVYYVSQSPQRLNLIPPRDDGR
ncbi:MAG TPA: DUF4436 family protein, partial [Acidimicrobiales bacterium]|nr:DUF4436 family protein [Acidimicrobiales bacterium]